MPGTYLVDQNGNPITSANRLPVDAQLTGSNVTDGQTLWTPGMLYNETTSDKPRGNTQGTLLASAARTANLYSPLNTNYNARGVRININVTNVLGTTPTLTGQFWVLDPVTSALIAVSTASTNITAAGNYQLELYPTPFTNPDPSIILSVSRHLPRSWAILFSISGTTPNFTFSAGYSLTL